MMIEAIITLMLFLAIYGSKIILYALFGIQLHALCIHICLVYDLSIFDHWHYQFECFFFLKLFHF